MDWKKWFEEHKHDSIKVATWGGDDFEAFETMYQAFKARLYAEWFSVEACRAMDMSSAIEKRKEE